MQIPLLNQVETPTAKPSAERSSMREAAVSEHSFEKALAKANSADTVRENEPSKTTKTESNDQIGADNSDFDPKVGSTDSDAPATQNDSATPTETTEVQPDERPLDNAEPDVATVQIVAAHIVPMRANAAPEQANTNIADNAQPGTTPSPTVKVAEGVSTVNENQRTTPQPVATPVVDRAEASTQPGTPRADTSTDRPAGSREQNGNNTETQTQARTGPVQQRDGQSAADTGQRDSSSPRDNHTAKSPSLPQIVSKEESTPAVSRANEVNLAMRVAVAAPDDGPPKTALSATLLSSTAQPLEVGGRIETNSAPQLAQVSRAGSGADLQQTETRPTDSAYRIVRGMQTMLNTRGGAMNMRLDPPELGTMRIVMSVHNGTVSATFEVQTAAAMNALNQSMTALRHSLEQQGLLVERLHVHTAPQTQTESNLNQDRSSDEQDRSRFADAGQGESRGRRDETQSDDQTTRNSKAKPVFTLTPNQ